MYILGISCYYHDSAACILKDGELIAASTEERFSRIKHDNGFPNLAIEFCLESAGITTDDLDYAVFYEKPFLKMQRILMSSLGTYPRSIGFFRESMISWFNEKLWIKTQLLDKLNIPDKKLLFVEHHLSHAASTFFTAGWDDKETPRPYYRGWCKEQIRWRAAGLIQVAVFWESDTPNNNIILMMNWDLIDRPSEADQILKSKSGVPSRHAQDALMVVQYNIQDET